MEKNEFNFNALIASITNLTDKDTIDFIIEDICHKLDEQLKTIPPEVDLDCEKQLIKEIRDHATNHPEDADDLTDFILRHGTRNLTIEKERELLEIFLRPMSDD